MNDVKSAASVVKSIHDPWKCISSKALICKEAKHWNKKLMFKNQLENKLCNGRTFVRQLLHQLKYKTLYFM